MLKVLGNGRSLVSADLSGKTIGTNRISKLHIPNYYVGVSHKLYRYWKDTIPKEGKVFVADWMSVEWAIQIKVDYNEWWKEGDVYGVAGGSLFPMLQMGMDLGYSDFEILGCDGFVEWEDGNDMNHWDKRYFDGIANPPDIEWLKGILEEGHQRAAEKMKGCRVRFGTPSPFEKFWR